MAKSIVVRLQQRIGVKQWGLMPHPSSPILREKKLVSIWADLLGLKQWEYQLLPLGDICLGNSLTSASAFGVEATHAMCLSHQWSLNSPKPSWRFTESPYCNKNQGLFRFRDVIAACAFPQPLVARSVTLTLLSSLTRCWESFQHRSPSSDSWFPSIISWAPSISTTCIHAIRLTGYFNITAQIEHFNEIKKDEVSGQSLKCEDNSIK